MEPFRVTDDGKTTTLKINDTDTTVSPPANLWYINIVAGVVGADGVIKNRIARGVVVYRRHRCTSDIESGYQFIDVPATNSVTIDGVINPASRGERK